MDSTSFIDATAITQIETAVADTLINDFSDQSKTLETKSSSLLAQAERIKDEISSIDPSKFTPPSVLDDYTGQALNASYESSAWLMAEDATQQIQAVKQRCPVLNEASKYVDTGALIDSMEGGVLKGAMDALDNKLDEFKINFPHLEFPELAIGKKLSSLFNTGRSPFDSVATSFSGAVNDVIEHGKAGLAKAKAAIDKAGAAVDGAVTVAEGALASLVGPLKMLDQLTNCVDTLGGVEYVGKTQQMIDQSNEIFDKLGIESDPNSPNFGEFDETSYLDSIGGLTSSQKSNIKKSMNMYNKASNNAAGVVEKAKERAKLVQDKSTSSLSGGSTITTERKKNFVDENVKVEIEIPAIPGKAPAKTETPQAEEVPPAPANVPSKPAAAGIAYADMVKSYEVTITGTNYLNFDPTLKGIEQYKADLIRAIPMGVTTTEAKDLRMEMVMGNVTHKIKTVSSFFGEDDKSHVFMVGTIYLKLWRTDVNKNIALHSVGYWESDAVKESNFREFDPDMLTSGTIKAVREIFTDALFRHQFTIEEMELLLNV